MGAYSWKSSADDMAELMRQLDIPRVILLGHDWCFPQTPGSHPTLTAFVRGGIIVSRIYHWHPEIVTHIVSVCTPYHGLMKKHVPIEELVESVPTFTYQIGFADPQTERDLESEEAIGRFLRALYRGIGDTFTGVFQVKENVLEALGDQPRGKLLTQKVRIRDSGLQSLTIGRI